MTPDASIIVYKGIDSRIHEYYFDNPTSTWIHTIIDPTSTDPHKLIKGDIKISADGNHIVYDGGDDRLQEYYRDGSSWAHIWLTDFGSSSQNVNGDIVITSAPNSGDHIFYRGIDGYLHAYIWTPPNTWTHSFVSDGSSSNIQVNGKLSASPDADLIYFEGTDQYVHQLYHPVSGVYGHDQIICYNDLVSSYGTLGPIACWNNSTYYKVFYAGNDNYAYKIIQYQ